MKRNKWFLILALLSMGMTLLTGCFGQTEPVNSQPKTLKVLASEWVYRDFGQLFEITHENVTTELINMDQLYQKMYSQQQNMKDPNAKPIEPIDIYREALTGPNPPDVVYIDNVAIFPKLVEEGLLQPLDTYIQKEKYDTTGIAPAVIDGIKEMGNGTLYALAPNFSAAALFYNKTFFDKRGVEYPKDHMTWDQIFNLARQLTYEENGEKKYGLSMGYGDLYNQVQQFVSQSGLSPFDKDFKTFTVNTPEYEKIWSTFIDMQKQEVIAPPFNYEEQVKKNGGKMMPFVEHDFISGRAAMMVMRYEEIRQLYDVMNGNMYFGPDAQMPEKFDWDVVTYPVMEEGSDIGGLVYYNGMMAINAKAQEPDLAWEYVAFMNGDKVAKARSQASWQLSSRTEYNQPPAGLNINMQAFTALKPAPMQDDNAFYTKFNRLDPWSIYQVGQQEFEAARTGQKTVQQALADYQKKGQEMLDNLNKGLMTNGQQSPQQSVGGASGVRPMPVMP
ncbi:extracellular solute-binding protein [Thermicanus aegyptius]|uniref:extracellular solute-binding protein n=1 Tax=Thermicanus aegyptius TaxID=94009 RepID=UPI00048E7E7F|nr:extracellular solute-binding protein [Thermicanus aegyptius]